MFGIEGLDMTGRWMIVVVASGLLAGGCGGGTVTTSHDAGWTPEKGSTADVECCGGETSGTGGGRDTWSGGETESGGGGRVDDAGSVRDAAVDAGGGGYCEGRGTGTYCDGETLITCTQGTETGRMGCAEGCFSTETPGEGSCAPPLEEPMCPDVPASTSPNPTTQKCNHMDWGLSPDGFYLFSKFGMDLDMSTWGSPTTCGIMQTEYDNRGCQYSYEEGECVGQETDIPWIQGDVDYRTDTALPQVRKHRGGDVPYPEYFYVAGAQRFGCGALLRVSDLESGNCVVVYAEDGGPNSTYEMAGEGGRRILDSSPAVLEYLGLQNDCCWGSGNMVYVEWAKPGDEPGQRCTPCTSTPVEAGTEDRRTKWDVDHLHGNSCRD